MSNQAIVDYLTKKLYIEKAIVTYRLLSREFRIHVNAAKKELAKFHTEGPYLSHPVESFATYLISGEILSPKSQPSSSQVFDNEDENPYLDEDEDKNEDDFEFWDSEEVPQHQMILVGEDKLEGMKARFRRVNSTHVYSLTPSPLVDYSLICTATDQVREIDNMKGEEMARAVGKIIGPPLEYFAKPMKIVSISSIPKINSAAKREEAKSKESQVTKSEKQPKPTQEPKPPGTMVEKPKLSGKSDFFKPKPRELKKEVKPKAETKDKPAARTFFNARKETAGSSRGTKRKSVTPSMKSESDDDVRLTSTAQSKSISKQKVSQEEPDKKAVTRATKGSLRVKKGIVLSDDEDAPHAKGKATARTSEVDCGAEKAAKALMDIDDEHVTRILRSSVASEEDRVKANEQMKVDISVQPEVDEDIEMQDDEMPKPKPKQRKPRKVVPVGRNGLRKKRVIKSRTKLDEKGYMATEDYSSYESVEEETEKVSAKAAAETDGGANESDSATAKIRTKTKKPAKGKTTKGGQSSLASFFGPSKAKK